MLQPPGSSSGRNRTYNSNNRRKTQETPEDALRQLQRNAPNKKCADCGERLPQNIDLTVGVFICISCAGIHRELNNRVKGIGHSSFTQEEVDKLKTTDNDKVNALWLARYNPQNERMKPPEGNQNQQQLRAWIRRKYQDKAWYGEGGSDGSGSGGPPGAQGRRPPSRQGGQPQQRPNNNQPAPTMVQMPSANQTPAQQPDLFDAFGGGPAPAPAPTPTKSDGWDAFRGPGQQPQQPHDPFAQPPAQQQQQPQNNFANFPAPGGAPPQQQQPQGQQQNFAKFGGGPPQAPQQPQQQFGNFANFPPQQQQFGNYGPQGGGAPTNNMQGPPLLHQPPNNMQGHPQQHQQQQFGNFNQPGGAPQQMIQQPPQGQPPQQQGFAAFNQMQPQQQQQHPRAPAPGQPPQMRGMPQQPQPQGLAPGQPPQMGGMQQHQQQQQQPKGFAAFDQMQAPPQQMGAMPSQPPQQQQQGGPQPNMQQSQMGGMGQMGGIPQQQQQKPQNGFGAFGQLQQQQSQTQSSGGAPAPNQSAGGPPDGSVKSAPKEDAMEAFAHLSVGKDQPASAPAPAMAPHTQANDDNNAATTQTAKFSEDQIVCYTSNGDRSKAKIAKVHLDHALEPFYTIKLEFGKEKQTDGAHLQALDPLFEKLESAMLGLTGDQLAKVEEFVSQLPPSKALEKAIPASAPDVNNATEGMGQPKTNGDVPSSVTPPSPGGMSHVSQLTQPMAGQNQGSAQPGAGAANNGGGLSTVHSPGALKPLQQQQQQQQQQGMPRQQMMNNPQMQRAQMGFGPPQQGMMNGQQQPQQGQYGQNPGMMPQGMPQMQSPQPGMHQGQGMPPPQQQMNNLQMQQPQMGFAPQQQGQFGQNSGMMPQGMPHQQAPQQGMPPQQQMMNNQQMQQPQAGQHPLSPQGNPFDKY